MKIKKFYWGPIDGAIIKHKRFLILRSPGVSYNRAYLRLCWPLQARVILWGLDLEINWYGSKTTEEWWQRKRKDWRLAPFNFHHSLLSIIAIGY